MSLYLDASVLMPIILLEQNTITVRDFLFGRTADLFVSDFAAAEVASALSRLVRTGQMTGAEAVDRLSDFDAWRAGETEDAELAASDCRLAGTYVRRFALKLRAPDALHAAICHRLVLQLVTLDARLATAARELGIEVVVPGE